MNTIDRNHINFSVSLDRLNNKVTPADFGQMMETVSYEYNNSNNDNGDVKKIDIITPNNSPRKQLLLKSEQPLVVFNKNNKPASPTATANAKKRSKPRRQSGLQTANITEDTFKQSRPYLPRDDSVFLLKQETTNAIPIIVPLVPDTQEESSASSAQQGNNGPLSRIQRHRRKPRRLSGDAVEHETRPVLVRDDSLLLTKKKLAGLFPMTYEDEQQQQEEEEHRSSSSIESGAKDEEQQKEEELEEDDITMTEAEAQEGLEQTDLTRRQKQQGYVRQNSLGARSA